MSTCRTLKTQSSKAQILGSVPQRPVETGVSLRAAERPTFVTAYSTITNRKPVVLDLDHDVADIRIGGCRSSQSEAVLDNVRPRRIQRNREIRVITASQIDSV